MRSFPIKRLLIPVAILLASPLLLSAQEPANSIKLDSAVIAVCKPQFLVAFSHFPELAHTSIRVRIKHTYTPLSTRPRWSTVFRRSDKRVYIITISDSSMSMLDPILFKRMTYEAQVGVLGHELSHVSDFSHKSLFGLIRIGIGHLSSHYLDRFEYKTDSLCIEHGLGNYLLAWSIFVRQALHHADWRGADNINAVPARRERYMNPSTIEQRIKAKTKS